MPKNKIIHTIFFIKELLRLCKLLKYVNLMLRIKELIGCLVCKGQPENETGPAQWGSHLIVDS